MRMKNFIFKDFLSLDDFSWLIFDIFLKGCFVALGKLCDGKVLLNVLCDYALRQKIYKQCFRYIFSPCIFSSKRPINIFSKLLDETMV